MLTYALLDSPDTLEGHGLTYRKIEEYVKKKIRGTRVLLTRRVPLLQKHGGNWKEVVRNQLSDK